MQEEIDSLRKEEIIKYKMNDVLEGGEILKIKYDRTMKALFNNKNKEGVKWFVAKILEKDINEIDDITIFDNNELAPLNIHDKSKTVDFIVHVGNDTIIMELNNNNSGKDYTRNLLYTFHALLNSIEIGESYHEIHGYLINLNWFNEKEKKYYEMEGEQIINYPYPKLGYEDSKNIITVKNVNLSFYDKLTYNGIKMKDLLWKIFTIDKKEELRDIGKNIKELSYYCRELERLSQSKEFCMIIWNEKLEKNLQNVAAYTDGEEAGIKKGKSLGIEEGRNLGIKEGKSLGIEEGKNLGIEEATKSIVRSLYENGVSIDIISKSTGLNEQEIDEIIRNS